MKNLFITLAVAAVYLLFSIFTGLWAVSWLIWVFYGVYMLVQIFKKMDQ